MPSEKNHGKVSAWKRASEVWRTKELIDHFESGIPVQSPGTVSLNPVNADVNGKVPNCGTALASTTG
jgi:hypothetical protein